MNKRYIVAGIIIFILLVSMAAFIRLFVPTQLSSHNVTFRLLQPNTEVTVYKDSTQPGHSTKLSNFTATKTLQLQNGSYYYVATGQDIATASIAFSVSNARIIEVNPSFTGTYLNAQIASQLPQINAAIRQAYPKITNDYVINSGKLFLQGQWYGTTISDKRSTNRNPYDAYRIVLLKQNDVWQVMTKPEINLSIPNYPGIPKVVLSSINNIDPLNVPATPRPIIYN